jgi:hypothetical protein
VKVEVSHHVDASEPDAQGFYDYHYEYDIFTFSEGNVSFLARTYTDQPNEASFMARHVADRRHLLTERDLQNPLLLEAQDYLRAAGKTDLNWLDGERSEYRPIAPAASQRTDP